MKWELWNAATIAERTDYEYRYIAEKIVMRDDFPEPIRLKNEHGEHVGKPRWVASEVMAWFEAHRDAMPDPRPTGDNRAAAS